MSGADSDLHSWVSAELAEILGSEIDGTLIEYLISLTSEEERRGFLRDIVPNDTTYIQTFLDKFQAKQSIHSKPPLTDGFVPMFDSNYTRPISPIQPNTLLQMPLIQDPPKTSRNQSTVPVEEEPPDSLRPYMKPSQNEIVYMPERKHVSIVKSSTKNTQNRCEESEDSTIKKKPGQKFVPFTSSEGSRLSTRLPGRHSCQCIGQKHTLVNNCLECGRVVCSQEGPGPCLFCGSLVFSPKVQETIRKGGRKGAAKVENIMKKFHIENADEIRGSVENSGNLNKAVAYKDRLLEYDKTCQQRTKVYDDESDYYRATKWMSSEEAARAKQAEEMQHKLKHPSKRGAVAVTLDFAGRQVLEGHKAQLSDQEAEAFIAGNNRGAEVEYHTAENAHLNADSLAHPNIPFTPKFTQTRAMARSHETRSNDVSVSDESVSNYRIQDSHLSGLSDNGVCLSMHQPWASLLVSGVKRVEGRTWYTTHRGTLWIASTAQMPCEQEVEEVEESYRLLRGDVDFPSSYPVGTLLGCVYLSECLKREDYISLGFRDESESPYGFLCEDPQTLKIQVPIKGMHKIWKLNKNTHNMCKRFLAPSDPVY